MSYGDGASGNELHCASIYRCRNHAWIARGTCVVSWSLDAQELAHRRWHGAIAVGQHRRPLDIDGIELTAHPAIPRPRSEPADVAARIDTSPQVLLEQRDVAGRADRALAGHDDRAELDDSVERIGPGCRIAVERQWWHSERAHCAGEHDTCAGHLYDEVLFDLTGGGHGD